MLYQPYEEEEENLLEILSLGAGSLSLFVGLAIGLDGLPALAQDALRIFVGLINLAMLIIFGGFFFRQAHKKLPLSTPKELFAKLASSKRPLTSLTSKDFVQKGKTRKQDGVLGVGSAEGAINPMSPQDREEFVRSKRNVSSAATQVSQAPSQTPSQTPQAAEPNFL